MTILLNDNFKKGSVEFNLIELVNENPQLFKTSTINEIADLLYINASSLSRAVKRIGYESYKDFRDYLIVKIDEIQEVKHLDHFENTADLVKNFQYLNKSMIDETLKCISIEQLDAITDEIMNKKRIYLYGIGFFSYMCHQLNKNFNLMNINSHNLETFYDALKVINQPINQDDDNMWIVFSKSLTTIEICFILEELIAANKTILLITSNNKSWLFDKVKYKLLLKTLYKDDDMWSLNTKLSSVIITNLLIETISNKLNFNKLEQASAFQEKTNKWKAYNNLKK